MGLTFAMIFSLLFSTFHFHPPLLLHLYDAEIIGKVPAGFNKFEYPALNNDFYGEVGSQPCVLDCDLFLSISRDRHDGRLLLVGWLIDTGICITCNLAITRSLFFSSRPRQGIPFGKVMICALPIALLTYLESVSVARKYALYNKYALGTCCRKRRLRAEGFLCRMLRIE